MNDDNQPSGNPWIKSLMVWGGIFLALLLVVSMFGPKTDPAASQMRYSDFRAKVAEGSVSEIQIAPDKITGTLKNNTPFSTVPIAGDSGLTKLLDENGVLFLSVPVILSGAIWTSLTDPSATFARKSE